ncbi:MAG: 50S ribosomal protein L11 methyltransferase [Eubacterium sp.]|nr:50S ribosomal protein L11 methyltransferase [Eubacterium sp.]
MKWTRFTINTHIDAVDVLSYELDAIGIEGIEIEDSIPLSREDKEKMFVDILPDPEEPSEEAKVSFYMDTKDCNPEQTIFQVQEILKDISSYINIGKGTVEVSETQDKDWINNWKEYFKPFRASDRIAICPTWIDEVPEDLLSEKYSDSGDGYIFTEKQPQILRIDPGIAFGTGSHETTKLCIRKLDEILKGGESVLDVGCGSGILTIAALLLGASHAVATDIDEVAVKVARENFDVNSINPDSYELLAGNVLGDMDFAGKIVSLASMSSETGRPGYDIVVANILPDVIVPLTAFVPGFLKEGGTYITSGILVERELEVRAALEKADFKNITTTVMGEWVSISATI